jgi:hypothetical protein
MGAKLLIISAEETLLVYFRTQLATNAPDVFAGRITNRHHYTDGWQEADTAMTVRMDGGTPSNYVAEQQGRFEVRIYAESFSKAEQGLRYVQYVIRHFQRVVVPTEDGMALLQRLVVSASPSQQVDPDLEKPYILFFIDAAVSEDAAA